MSADFLNTLSWVGYYGAVAVWAVLLLILVRNVIKRNRQGTIRTVKFSINSLVFLLGWMFFLDLALIVRPPIYSTRQASVDGLHSLIRAHQLNDIYIGAVFLLLLLGINLVFYYWPEKRQHKKDIIILAVISLLVLGFSIWFTGESAWCGLLREINLHFGYMN